MEDYVVDGDKFFISMVLELLNKESKTNNYIFKRIGEFLNFYSEDLEYNKVTVVENDNQFKEYYDQISNIFVGNISEMVKYDKDSAKLYAIINGKIVGIQSDNLVDDWINKKTTSRVLVPRR